MAIFLQKGCTNAPKPSSRFAIALNAITPTWLKQVTQWVIAAVFCLAAGCTQVNAPVRLLELPDRPTGNEMRTLSGDISEVAPPAVFLDLANLASSLQPQVEIAYPKPNQTLTETEFAAKIKLRGLSIYKEEKTQLGPHLKAILDNQPARDVYDLDEPIAFSELLPGSHTLRVFAVLPWGESFKNTAAYAQTTFHILAPTAENTPDSDLPLLTYNEPQGTFGAQPILLDFYLHNAPLHLVASESSEDALRDWQVRCTVNGQTFLFDQWRPVYLKGLKPGQNWVQLSLVDEQGESIDNAFNSTVRLIKYDPEIKDTLSKLVRGELPVEQTGQTVILDYKSPAEPLLIPTLLEDTVKLPLEPLEEASQPAENRALDPDRLPSEEDDKSLPLLNSLEENKNLEETKDLEETERESLTVDNSSEKIPSREIPEELIAPAAEKDIDFSSQSENADVDQDEAFEAAEKSTFETELPPDIAPFEPELSEPRLPKSESPVKTGFLERLKTKWSAFQKAQVESQSETIQPAKTPINPSTQSYTHVDELHEDTEYANDSNESIDTVESTGMVENAEGQTTNTTDPIEPELP